MKILVNCCFGGFDLNEKAELILEDKNTYYDINKVHVPSVNFYDYYDYDERTHPKLIKMVENGESINGKYGSIRVAEIPDESTDFTIIDYDGVESVLYILNGKINYA